MTGPSFEEMRAAYLATVLDIDVRRVLAAIQAWNAMSDDEKRRASRQSPARERADA